MRRARIAPVGSAPRRRAPRPRCGGRSSPRRRAARASRRRSSWPCAIRIARPWPSVSSPAASSVERLVGQVEQAQQVRHRDARAADAAADLLARQPELLDQQRAGARLLDRVEVLARHVLDQRELERLGVVVRAHERRDRVEPRELGGAPAPLAGDQLVGAVGRRADEHRLEHAALAQRAGEREQRLPRRTPCAAGAGWARSGRPGAGAGRGHRRRRSSCSGSAGPPVRGPSPGWAQPRCATSLASSK